MEEEWKKRGGLNRMTDGTPNIDLVLDAERKAIKSPVGRWIGGLVFPDTNYNLRTYASSIHIKNNTLRYSARYRRYYHLPTHYHPHYRRTPAPYCIANSAARRIVALGGCEKLYADFLCTFFCSLTNATNFLQRS